MPVTFRISWWCVAWFINYAITCNLVVLLTWDFRYSLHISQVLRLLAKTRFSHGIFWLLGYHGNRRCFACLTTWTRKWVQLTKSHSRQTRLKTINTADNIRSAINDIKWKCIWIRYDFLTFITLWLPKEYRLLRIEFAWRRLCINF